MSPLSSFRLALGSPTLANSGSAPAGSLKDDSGMRGHLAAQLKSVRMILVFSDSTGKSACATKSKDHKSSSAGGGHLYPNRPKGLSGTPVDDRRAGNALETA
jgi:hypothetical protein